MSTHQEIIDAQKRVFEGPCYSKHLLHPGMLENLYNEIESLKGALQIDNWRERAIKAEAELWDLQSIDVNRQTAIQSALGEVSRLKEELAVINSGSESMGEYERREFATQNEAGGAMRVAWWVPDGIFQDLRKAYKALEGQFHHAVDERVAADAKRESLRVAVADLIDLTESWAYGPIMQAGVTWPDGVCQAPALIKAKEVVK